MWTLTQTPAGEFLLVFDKERRPSSSIRGVWTHICQQDDDKAQTYVDANLDTGHLCCLDNEGGVRVLILED